MKKITLDGPIYKKFFEITEKVLKNLDKDVALINISTNLKKLLELSIKNGGGEDEAFGRGAHYIVLDNINIIGDYLDFSKEVEYLKNTFVGIFEIVEKNDDKVVFLDISTGKKYDIIGEGDGSEYKLNNFNVGDLIISRLIKLDDGWYNMKNYYFILQDNIEEEIFEKLKIGYKHIFYGIKDVLDIEEKMDFFNSGIEKNDENKDVNYLKRIKQILLKPLGKKTFKKIEKILKNLDNSSYDEILKIIKNSNKKIENFDKLKEYLSSYIKQNSKTDEEIKQEELNERLTMVVNSFFSYLHSINIEIPSDRRMTEEENRKLEEIKKEWFNTENTLFGNKKPIDFIREIEPDYEISRLQIQQTSAEEQEFYDGYNKIFTDEENEIYGEALKKSIDGKYEEAAELYEKLLGRYGDFFRLKGNYLVVRLNSIIDRYGDVRDNSFIKKYSLEELEKDYDFLLDLEKEVEELYKLKPGYTLQSNVDPLEIREAFAPILRIGIRDKIKEIIKKSDEKQILEMTKNIIPDFSVEEFLDKVREINSTFVDYNGRIKKGLRYKEDYMYDFFIYFWNKYKSKDDFTDEDIIKMYKKIGVRKIKEEELKKFNEFVFKNKKQITSKKSVIPDEMISAIEIGDITLPINILEKIEDEKLKKDFEKSLDILGLEYC